MCELQHNIFDTVKCAYIFFEMPCRCFMSQFYLNWWNIVEYDWKHILLPKGCTHNKLSSPQRMRFQFLKKKSRIIFWSILFIVSPALFPHLARSGVGESFRGPTQKASCSCYWADGPIHSSSSKHISSLCVFWMHPSCRPLCQDAAKQEMNICAPLELISYSNWFPISGQRLSGDGTQYRGGPCFECMWDNLPTAVHANETGDEPVSWSGCFKTGNDHKSVVAGEKIACHKSERQKADAEN